MPKSRIGRIALQAVMWVPTLTAIAAVTWIGVRVGSGVTAFALAVTTPAIVWAWWRARKVKTLRVADPAAAQRIVDRDSARIGKLWAGIAFATIGVGVIAVIAIFATHA